MQSTVQRRRATAPIASALIPRVVRGLDYYTGPVFECELTLETRDETGQPCASARSAAAGAMTISWRASRGETVPATGFSMGVSRLYAALKLLGKADEGGAAQARSSCWCSIATGRAIISAWCPSCAAAGIRAEMYLGTSGMKAQMKYADRRGAPLVVIQGEDERQAGDVQIKDLRRAPNSPGRIDSREE